MGCKTEQSVIIRVSRVGIVLNLALTILKFAAAILAHSSAMFADAIHSASDIFGSVLVIIGAKVSGREADQEHPYGHERMECVVSMILANILLLAAAGIGISGLEKIFSGAYASLEAPGRLALGAALLSILVKEGLFWYTRTAAKQVNSVSLMAEAWHHRSDALSSIGSFAGILGARMGFPVLDPLASVLISLCIIKVAVDIYKETIDRMVDRSCDARTEAAMRELILNCEGVERLDVLRTRLFGSKLYAEVEIGADESLSLRKAHDIAVLVHNRIEENFPLVKHCVVHVNPVNATGRS